LYVNDLLQIELFWNMNFYEFYQSRPEIRT